MIEIIAMILRVIGAVWAMGALFIVGNALKLGRSAEARRIPGRGAPTFVAGIPLFVGSRYAFFAAVAVAVEQAFLHWLRARKLGQKAPRPTHVWITPAVAAIAIPVTQADAFG